LLPVIGEASCDPEVFELSGAEVTLRAPKSGRLLLRVAPPDNTKVRHIFLGFNEIWERNLWMTWIKQVSGRVGVHDRIIRQKNPTTGFRP
jgi:hypothetical protein